jgi:hypothetical protein
MMKYFTDDVLFTLFYWFFACVLLLIVGIILKRGE